MQLRSSIRSTVCPRSSDPFYIVTYYIKWVTTSWTYSIYKCLHSVFVPWYISGELEKRVLLCIQLLLNHIQTCVKKNIGLSS